MSKHRTIEHPIADADDDSGDQVGVNGHVAAGLHTNRFFHSRFNGLANVVVQFCGDANVDISYAALLGEKLVNLSRERTEELEPAVPREDFQKIRYLSRSSLAE